MSVVIKKQPVAGFVSICDIGSPRYGPRPERAKVERISGDVMSNGAFAESDSSLLLQHW